ncbi:NUDIX hydrolase [Shewanella amazonensis]|uniref:MutT/nudix family protein n=1 Tax=Shewanella amazonensis (strain ATCC BAA-1098 / SB2B) TaxID=326297 RepID=A1S1H3_SHEAM|nr:NUDIX domain-containing protein [Shewanella amazonensis]ABL98229.1 MutT/nudix family protein [Shewanella amazonensis SB2B]
MAFDDTFRLSSHAVITNDKNNVLLLKADYGNKHWGLPGGALEPGETIHQALIRECLEELGQLVAIDYLSGVYFHSAYNSQAFIFRARLTSPNIILSPEHSEYGFFVPDSLHAVQQRRISECLDFNGKVVSAAF